LPNISQVRSEKRTTSQPRRKPFTPIRIDNEFLAEPSDSDSFLSEIENDLQALRQKREQLKDDSDSDGEFELPPEFLKAAAPPIFDDELADGDPIEAVETPTQSNLLDIEISTLFSAITSRAQKLKETLNPSRKPVPALDVLDVMLPQTEEEEDDARSSATVVQQANLNDSVCTVVPAHTDIITDSLTSLNSKHLAEKKVLETEVYYYQQVCKRLVTKYKTLLKTRKRQDFQLLQLERLRESDRELKLQLNSLAAEKLDLTQKFSLCKKLITGFEQARVEQMAEAENLI
jgi:mRNA-degrading endonuclease toxin of MazEF toxin-antitoxin module